MGLLNPGLADNRAVLQHVLQVHQVAVVHVLGKIIGVMEMDDALLVSLHDVLGKEHPLGQVLADLPGHVSLCTLLTVGFLLEFSCFTSSLLHSIRDRMRLSVVLALRIRER